MKNGSFSIIVRGIGSFCRTVFRTPMQNKRDINRSCCAFDWTLRSCFTFNKYVLLAKPAILNLLALTTPKTSEPMWPSENFKEIERNSNGTPSCYRLDQGFTTICNVWTPSVIILFPWTPIPIRYIKTSFKETSFKIPMLLFSH